MDNKRWKCGMKICPKCGRSFERILALSRTDSKTMICDECGTMEALDSLPHGILTPQERTRIAVAAQGINGRWKILMPHITDWRRGGMYRQMDMFDLMGGVPECGHPPPRTQFERLFEKVKNSLIPCANCLCQYCVNNVEEMWNKVRPEEMQEPCFNCDECRVYSGERMLKEQRKEECGDFAMSDYGVGRNRKRMRLIKNGEGLYGCRRNKEA